MKVLPNNISCFAVFLSAKGCQENIEVNKFVEIDIVATCKFRYNLLAHEHCNIDGNAAILGGTEHLI